jgi:ATPase family associated with various cellular activities (AAA)/FtsK/SpoIIIE family
MRKLPFFDDFQMIDPTVSPRVLKVENRNYQVDVFLSNLLIAHSKTFPLTKSFFGTEKITVSYDNQEKALKISLPLIQVPNYQYALREISGYLMQEHPGDWILGINDYGPVHFPISRLTHAIVIGASGYGKSSFFKYLLAQTLAHQPDIVNVIIDPKRVDYSMFADHPNVYMVADNKEKWINLLYLLLAEIETRKEFFSKSFKRSPSNLEEYKEFKQAYNREDLPKFERILIWIDEYHVLQRQDQFTPIEIEKECLGYIARVGRAFGIHLMLSSQTYTDFSSEIRNQASTVFNFYTTSAGYVSDQIPVIQNLAIPGRLHQSIGKEVVENIQAPFLTVEESIGYAWKYFRPKKKISPFYPLRLSHCEDFGKDFVLPLMQGHGLYRTGNKKSTSSSKVPDDIFRKHHFISNAPVPTKTAAVTETTSPSVAEMIKIDVSDNRLKLDEIMKKLDLKTSFNLDWCLIDKDKNSGLEHCYRNMINPLLATDEFREKMNIYNLALNYQNSQTLMKYLSDIENILPTSGSSPLLIIKGKDGMGKRTVLHVLAHHLGLSYRPIEPEDLLSAKEGKENKKDEILVIENLKVAAEFCRHPGTNQHPLLLIDSTPVKTIFGQGSEFSLDELRYLNVFYYFIDLDAKNYASEDVCDVLLKGILTKYGYDFTSGHPSSEILARKGVPLVPGKIDSLVARASSRCKYFGRRFQNQDLLSELQSFESIKDYSAHEAVATIRPVKGFDDLILESDLKAQLKLIVQSAARSEGQFKFHEKLRANKRNISLFYGDSGTGKSLAAEAIAKELGKELWVVNFGDLQSMFVGETEKILSGLFERASLSGQVLLIDECEVFLRSRENDQSEYTGRIVNHLLNLFENFSGILILTSNFATDIDRAFSRRIDHKIRFPLPDESQMGSILSALLYPDAPLSEKLNPAFIFDGIRLSGGLIRNGLERVVQKKLAENPVLSISNDDLRAGMLQVYIENKGFLESKLSTSKIGLT